MKRRAWMSLKKALRKNFGIDDECFEYLSISLCSEYLSEIITRFEVTTFDTQVKSILSEKVFSKNALKSKES